MLPCVLFSVVSRLKTHVSDYSVYESRDPSCHDTSVYPACSYQRARWKKCPSYNICLIGRNKKRERKNFPSPHLPRCRAPTHEDRGWFHFAKDSWIFGQTSNGKPDPFRSPLTGIFGPTFDRTGPTEICHSVFDKPVHCPASFKYGIRKRNEKWLESDFFWLARFEIKMFRFPRVFGRWSSHLSGHYARFWYLLRLAKRDSQLEARARRLAK